MRALSYPVGTNVRIIDTTRANDDIPIGTIVGVESVAIYSEGYVYPISGTTMQDDDQWCYQISHDGEGAIVTHDEIEAVE